MTISAAPNQSQSSTEEQPQASATQEEERMVSLTDEERELLRVFHEIHEMILKYPDKVKEQWKKHPEKQQLFQSLIPQIELLEKKLSPQ
jgi:cell fate (sporulation/competence/biofilm development) regulator YlbF (YheA/YmcA/DUF963 family)